MSTTSTLSSPIPCHQHHKHCLQCCIMSLPLFVNLHTWVPPEPSLSSSFYYFFFIFRFDSHHLTKNPQSRDVTLIIWVTSFNYWTSCTFRGSSTLIGVTLKERCNRGVLQNSEKKWFVEGHYTHKNSASKDRIKITSIIQSGLKRGFVRGKATVVSVKIIKFPAHSRSPVEVIKRSYQQR